MTIKLFNTLTRTKEEFTTKNGTVRMYVCGITPYSESHIGHAMFSVVFDVIRRYLEYRGYDIKHVQNFTDIDDKMIVAANRLGISVSELGEQNINEYLQETDALNVQRAHVYPRATQEITRIIEMIERLVTEGYAYNVNGDVYFRVGKIEDYGKLSGRSLEGLMAGARVEVDEKKENAADFALWKSEKPGEPAWPSPWGPGRPGWHIECSAMSLEYLGNPIDIHGGGRDLIFPHHENEIAQSESYTGTKPFVRFWLHNGMLRIGDDKMSKSIGNIISVRDALSKFSSDAIRLFFLSSHYRSPLIYSEDSIAAQARAAERLRNAINLPATSCNGKSLDPEPYKMRYIEAMDDDFNTPRALAVMFDLVRDINRCREQGEDTSNAQAMLKEITGAVGLKMEEPEDQASSDAAPFIDLLIETRTGLRAARQFDLADQVRDKLTGLGVILEDTPDGTVWKYKQG